MKFQTIKIYGERNTGTNYLFKLIETNLKAKLLPGSDPEFLRSIQRWLPGHEYLLDLYSWITYQNNLGWKHSLVMRPEVLKSMKICSKNLHYITLTKNPYSWLLSLYKRPYHYNYKFSIFKNPYLRLLTLYRRPYHYTVKKLSFEQFLLSEWITTKRERTDKIIENPIELWNMKNRSYLNLHKNFDSLSLKYEELIANPEALIIKIKEKFKIYYKYSSFQNISQSTKGDKKDFSFYRKYYLEEQWKEQLSEESISIINQYLDKDLLNYYDYNLL